MDILNVYQSLGVLFLLIVNLVCVDALNYQFVTCGSVVKLANNNYKNRLHSHDIKYGSGSGQQSVTATDEQEDGNSYWTVKGSTVKQCTRGEPVSCGSNIRLEHANTKKNLHSHLFSSPLSGNQEISAFGDTSGEGDTGDNWTVVCNDEYWDRAENIRLKHVDTEKWLSISGRTYGRPINGQLEVIGASYPDSSSYWQTMEGVFVKPTEEKMGEVHDEL
jgi:dolichyl-phosphate-mannose--protein O-mannosyl transferase